MAPLDEVELSTVTNAAYESAKAHSAARVRNRRRSRPDAEAHRQRGIARLKAAGAPKILRLEITNTLTFNDYSAELAVGSKGAVANVILDTGSSTLAIEPSAYSGAGDTN